MRAEPPDLVSAFESVMSPDPEVVLPPTLLEDTVKPDVESVVNVTEGDANKAFIAVSDTVHVSPDNLRLKAAELVLAAKAKAPAVQLVLVMFC